MRILVVEDEQKLGGLIKDVLGKEGYAVDHVSDGQKALNRIQVNHTDYDLIILDLNLPNRGGFEILKEVRKIHIQTPFLILTADNSLGSKVSLLDAGADDYLIKPFEFDELLSRIRAITRRPKQALEPELTVGPITLNASTQKVFINGKEVNFTLKEFRMLEYFMRNPDKVLSREDITGNIWDFDFDSFSNIVDVFINKVRKKISNGKNSGAPTIETVRGVGYRLNSKASASF